MPPPEAKPNLFIIGAMKSGTSSICRDLSEHPSIFMSPIKEPEHFSSPDHRGSELERYLRLFSGASTERYLAEGSTQYTKRPEYDGVAERIHEFNPSARIVYVMRDPFERLVSHYRHQVRKGREKGSLLQAIRRDAQYLTISYYAYQLRPYLELFGPHAVYVDTFESYVSSPVSFGARLFQWLNLDASFVAPSAGQRLNANPDEVETYDEGSIRVRLARSVTRFLKHQPRLGRLVPDVARRWYRRLMPKESVQRVDSAEFSREVERARQAVQPLLMEWTAELQDLIRRPYDEWATTRPEAPYEDPLPKLSEIWLPQGVLQRLDDSSVGREQWVEVA